MDIGSIIGFISGAFFIIVSILMNAGFNVEKAAKLIDAPSLMITGGGTVAALIIAFPIAKALTGLKVIGKVFTPPKVDPKDAINKIITLANLARKEGILALEESVQSMEDDFLQKGIMLVVDGTDPELVRNVLETEMAYIEGRHGDARGVWEFIGSAGPAWGMIGTLIGLTMMLQDMSDLDALGPSMAVAIITTFYGSVIANFVALPVISKLKVFSAEEILIKEVLIEGILSIQAGENPRIIEEKLKAFLSPALRSSLNEESTGGGRAGEE